MQGRNCMQIAKIGNIMQSMYTDLYLSMRSYMFVPEREFAVFCMKMPKQMETGPRR